MKLKMHISSVKRKDKRNSQRRGYFSILRESLHGIKVRWKFKYRGILFSLSLHRGFRVSGIWYNNFEEQYIIKVSKLDKHYVLYFSEVAILSWYIDTKALSRDYSSRNKKTVVLSSSLWGYIYCRNFSIQVSNELFQLNIDSPFTIKT